VNENTGLEYMPSDMKCYIVCFSMVNILEYSYVIYTGTIQFHF